MNAVEVELLRIYVMDDNTVRVFGRSRPVASSSARWGAHDEAMPLSELVPWLREHLGLPTEYSLTYECPECHAEVDIREAEAL
jgi:hypothetical protein